MIALGIAKPTAVHYNELQEMGEMGEIAMFKPSDLNNGAWIREGQYQRQLRQANANASVHASNLAAWKEHAWELEARNKEITANHNSLVNKYNHAINLLRDANEAGQVASRGVAVAGYTNNMALELLMLRFELMAGLSDGNMSYAGLPFGNHQHRVEQAKQITLDQRKFINLRLLCRMEWYDWCLHNDVMAKFGAMVMAALLNPTPENAHLRGRRLLEAFGKESREYHALRDRAMNYEESEAIRDAFEEERYNYWNGRIAFGVQEDNNNAPYPSPTETRKRHPDQRFDLHLPAGRLARDFGINIETGAKADCYRKGSAASMLVGYGQANGGAWFY